MKIFCQFGKYEPFLVDRAKSIKVAEQKIACYERHDRYEIETEKYPMPTAWEGEYPKYFITK